MAVNQIGPSLESVLGVAAVNVSGGLQREWQVRVSYATLAAYDLSVQQVSTALAAANVTSTIASRSSRFSRFIKAHRVAS